MLVQLWPYINDMVVKILKEQVEPEIQKNVPGFLSSIHFEEISLGEVVSQTEYLIYSSTQNSDGCSKFCFGQSERTAESIETFFNTVCRTLVTCQSLSKFLINFDNSLIALVSTGLLKCKK